VTPRSIDAQWFRAGLVVLSDRRPPPGAPRTPLESAIESALREHDGVWLVRHAEAEPRTDGDAAGFSDRGSWSVLEGVPARSSMDEWAGYVRANAAYAEQIVESVSPDGIVWVIGHGWLLVASALRAYGYRGRIGLLLDVPFPAHEQLQVLPWHADVMSALCQPDMVWFQTPACVDNFEACRARAGLPPPWIGICPSTAGADPAEWVPRFLQMLAFAARRESGRRSAG
jgi:hypothetical protein